MLSVWLVVQPRLEPKTSHTRVKCSDKGDDLLQPTPYRSIVCKSFTINRHQHITPFEPTITREQR